MATRRREPAKGAKTPAEVPDASTDPDPDRPEKPARAPYVAPVLERLGNVRDIVGKTGPTRDNSQRFARKA